MATNSFLPFGEDCVDVLTDQEYSDSPTRTEGVQTGIAYSNFHNKLYKQMAGMSYAIGEVLKANGHNASDGNLEALIQSIINIFVPKQVGIILSASNWTQGDDGYYFQTISVQGVTSTTDGVLMIAQNITKEQLDAASSAKIHLVSQANNSVTVKCYGALPIVSIPCTLEITRVPGNS